MIDLKIHTKRRSVSNIDFDNLVYSSTIVEKKGTGSITIDVKYTLSRIHLREK